MSSAAVHNSHTPVRMCVGCRVSAAQNELIRLAVDETANVRADFARQMPGRGAYIHPSKECFQRGLPALKRALRKRSDLQAPLWSELAIHEWAGLQGNQPQKLKEGSANDCC